MSIATLPAASLSRLRRRLLAWFDKNARSLPWRQSRCPYSIWVSEVMLQQTQVATVIPFFERFLAAFPDVRSLAGAEEVDVLKLWQGLGYYRRARDLLRTARLIEERHGGVMPDEVEALRTLPGMGRYTVNAVLSQAFDARLPILEANSRRVLCRLGSMRDDPRTPAAEKTLWSWAERILPRRRAGDFNQALMELGALVCTPEKPRCGECPLKELCAAYRSGEQESIPQAPKRARIEEVREVAIIVRKGERFLLTQRAEQGRWANMWEFPHAVCAEAENAEEAAARLLEELGLRGTIGEECGTVRHGVTRFRITMECRLVRYRRGAFRPGAYRDSVWVTLEELGAYPLSSPQRRLARLLSQPRQRGLF